MSTLKPIPLAGRLRFFRENWEKYTSDEHVLQTVSGMRIRFDNVPQQTYTPYALSLSDNEKEAVSNEIKRLLKHKVIKMSHHETGEFISNIFTRPKKDGKHRMILNLSKLNEFVEYHHFKMDTLESGIKLITPNCYMASIDLSDAYYSVHIHESDQKYLKFSWQGQLYQFMALPNGLSSGPREFTKLLKPPLSHIRAKNHTIIAYIDDTFIIGQNKGKCTEAVKCTQQLFEELGFVINAQKSVIEPSQEIIFLGFVINSCYMTIRPTPEKCENIVKLCTMLIQKQSLKIEETASVLGKIVSLFPGAQYGPLHYRELETSKNSALAKSKGNYHGKMILSEGAKIELQWWIQNAASVSRKIHKGPFALTLTSDASGLGWGITDGNTEGGGRWNAEEAEHAKRNEINYLELLAAFMGLRTYCSAKSNLHVKMLLDNTTAIAYINNMGGTKSYNCNKLAKEIWGWCIAKGIWISAFHLAGSLNVIADRKSRDFSDESEWKLDPAAFNGLCLHFGKPDIDLFASRLNAQIHRFVSWKPDPDAEAIDAFSLDWSQFYFYAFPPFCLISRCLQQILFDGAEGLIVVPNWPTQPWYARLMEMLVVPPLHIPKQEHLLTQPISGQVHPLRSKLSLLCCRLSATALKTSHQK